MAPLPVNQAAMITLQWGDGVGLWGSRFFMAMSTSDEGPTAAEIQATATGVREAYASELASVISSSFTLNQVQVIPLQSTDWPAGVDSTNVDGGAGATDHTSNVSVDLNFEIDARWRGGHFLIHLPPPAVENTLNLREWTEALLEAYVGAWNNFITACDTNSDEGAGLGVQIGISYMSKGVARNPPVGYPIVNVRGRQPVGSMRRRARVRA